MQTCMTCAWWKRDPKAVWLGTCENPMTQDYNLPVSTTFWCTKWAIDRQIATPDAAKTKQGVKRS